MTFIDVKRPSNVALLPPKTVYLCGPITGLSYDDARNTWRKTVGGLLLPHIHALSPMRAKEFLSKEQCLNGVRTGYDEYDNPTACPRGIVTRDNNDLRNADAVIACFLGAEKVSVGSVWELGNAYVRMKPVVLVMEKDGTNPHHHAFVTETAGYWVDNVEEAAEIVNHLLTPGV